MATTKATRGESDLEHETVAVQQMNVPCCPELETDQTCDVLDFHYRLIHTPTVLVNDRQHRVPVEVLIHARLEKCSGPLALGDLVYSTTLLPGEKVRLFTTDRRSRFTFDSSTKLSYRNEQTSEERYYMSAMSDFMSDVTVRDEGRATNTKKGSFETHGETNGALEAFFAGPSVDVKGSYNAESTSEFMRELSEHAKASHSRSVESTRTASSVSVGEVQTRSHAEGESQEHFESSSREFANPNHCHAVTFFFYQINKRQTIKLTLESVRRRVIDPAADTRVTNNSFTSRGVISVIPSAVLATDKERLDIERLGRNSAVAQAAESVRLSSVANQRIGQFGLQLAATQLQFQTVDPLPADVRAAALQAVNADLVKAGLLDAQTNEVSEETKASFSFESQTSLPTGGLLVRGCLDDCNICEPEVQREIKLDLRRKELENELLKRKIELLEKSQEYRCCPAGEVEEGGTDE